MANEIEKRNEAFLIYQDENGIARVNVRFEGEDVWLNVEQIMELFDASQQDVSYHIKPHILALESYIDSCNSVFILINQESLIPFLYFVCHIFNLVFVSKSNQLFGKSILCVDESCTYDFFTKNNENYLQVMK